MFEPTGPNIFEWMCFGVGGAALFWLAILMGDGNHLGSFQLRKVRLVNLIAGFICPHCQGLICALGANKARITSLRRNDPAWEHSDKEDWTRHQQLADTAIWIHATTVGTFPSLMILGKSLLELMGKSHSMHMLSKPQIRRMGLNRLLHLLPEVSAPQQVDSLILHLICPPPDPQSRIGPVR